MFAFALACAMVTGVPFCQTKKTTVAVIDFNATSGLNKTEVITLTNRFRVMLVQTNAFSVIERNEMEQILKEQDFILSDNCNTSECAVQVGQLLGAEQMIAGDIGKVGETWTTDLRLIDITTGKIVKTQSGNYEGKIDGLLEIMQEIAFVFAGVKKPAEASIVIGRLSGGRLPAARARVDVRVGLPNYLGNVAAAGQEGGAAAFDIAFSYLVSKRMKIGIEAKHYSTYLNDTVTVVGNLENYDGTASMLGAGVTISYYLLTGDFKPYVYGSVGGQVLSLSFSRFGKEAQKRHGLIEGRTSVYFSPGVGFDVRLSNNVELQFLFKGFYTDPWDLVVLQGGLSYQFGRRLKE
jgi:TolB-like protein